MSRALAMAAAAWSASERTSAIWAALKASVRVANAPSAPNTSSPMASGATTMERMPMSSTTRSGSAACSNEGSLR